MGTERRAGPNQVEPRIRRGGTGLREHRIELRELRGDPEPAPKAVPFVPEGGHEVPFFVRGEGSLRQVAALFSERDRRFPTALEEHLGVVVEVAPQPVYLSIFCDLSREFLGFALSEG